jgi:hypothetical protein
MIFSKIFFDVWLARKNYKNAKIKVWQMSAESGNVRSPLPDFGEKVWPDPGRFGQIRPKSSGSAPINGRIRSYPAGLAGIRQYSGLHRAPVAGFRRQQDTGDRMLSNSSTGWIPTIDNC